MSVFLLDIMQGPEPVEFKGPVKVLTIENAISSDYCRDICEYIHAEYELNPVVSKHQRTAYSAPVNAEMKAALDDALYQLITQQIEPYFEQSVEWWEAPQLLRYTTGGSYNAHSDAEKYNTESGQGWVRVHDRDISIIIYLNDSFTGGHLDFPDHRLKIVPRPGLLVAFPSHHGYRHAAEQTESGERYVIATWAAAEGTPRVREVRPNRAMLKAEYQAGLSS